MQGIVNTMFLVKFQARSFTEKNLTDFKFSLKTVVQLINLLIIASNASQHQGRVTLVIYAIYLQEGRLEFQEIFDYLKMASIGCLKNYPTNRQHSEDCSFHKNPAYLAST
jgi:hypothetical protein